MPAESQVETPNFAELSDRGKCFYIDADVSEGWPFRASEALCKLGVTRKAPRDRCRENEEALRRWDVDARLAVCFVATGHVAGVEKEVLDHTLTWLPVGFERSAEWRFCPPRQLARVALLIAERRFRAENGHRPAAGIAESRGPAAPCRLEAPGTQVHLEPMPATGREWAGPSGRPLREPTPRGGPSAAGPSAVGPSAEGPSAEEPSPEEGSGENGISQRSARGFWAGAVPTDTGLSHRWLRQRNVLAEWKTLRDGNTGWSIPRDDGLSLRLGPLHRTLLGESLACSPYPDVSAYLRAAGTGRDRCAPVLAKGGILFFWTYAHLGQAVGEEEWIQLGRPAQLLLGVESPSSALGLFRRHLQARLAGAETGPREEVDEDGLPPVPAQVPGGKGSSGEKSQGDLSRGDPSQGALPPTVSVRISAERKKLIRENADISAYDGMSEYIRQMALGWDRAPSVVAQCDAIAGWMEERLGEPVGPGGWDRLGRRLGTFLRGSTGEKDPEGTLRRGTRHLLGTGPAQVAAETGLSP